ncbi:MAG: acyl-CoA synthetase [Enterococcus sp.]
MRRIMSFKPLNLYSNFYEAAEKYPTNRLISDELLGAFPEIQYETTYQALIPLIQQRAFQLAAFGIQKGDKVMIYKSPKMDTYLLAVSCAYLGAVPVMVSYHFPLATLQVFNERLEQPFILYDNETQTTVSLLKESDSDKQIHTRDLVLKAYKEVTQQYLTDDEISYMTHTSGTTGIPKLICHSANSMGWRVAWQKEIFKKITSDNRLLSFHISPVHSRYNIGMTSLMGLGFEILCLNNPNLENVAAMLSAYQPIALETHPNNFVQWRQLATRAAEAFHSIKYYHSTFDAINLGTMKEFLTASNQADARFLQVYGQSECGPMILKSHRLESIDQTDSRNMGRGLEGFTKARITDESGVELPANTNGHIQFYSKGRALTYYKESERFDENVYDAWWDSGDYGSMDEEGQLYLKDRQVDVIDEIDSTLAIEDFLLDSLNFLDEVVIIRGENYSTQPIIALKPEMPMDWDAWWQAIADLPHMNEPLIYAFDAIPRTATMKVQRLLLQEKFNQEQGLSRY